MSPLERLRGWFVDRGLDERQFAETVGLTPREFVALARKEQLSEEVKTRMEETFGLRTEYILTGRGPKIVPLLKEKPYQRIIKVREELQLSQAAFAKTFGLTQSGLSAVEKGAIPVRSMMALAIEAAHGVRHQWLLSGTGAMFVPARIPEHRKAFLDLIENADPLLVGAIKTVLENAQASQPWDGKNERRRRVDRRKKS